MTPGAGVPPAPGGPLRFPGGIAAVRLAGPGGASGEGRDLVALSDTGHHRVVLLTPAGEVVAVAGAGGAGAEDGPLDEATFRLPQGLTTWRGLLLVADTGNHAVRAIDLVRGEVTTLAGTGEAATTVTAWGAVPATPLRSPWDLAPWGAGVAVALAGSHALGLLDPGAGTLAPLAGTGSENLVDGPASTALFAQPSGLAADGARLWIADAESSALRVLRGGRVETVVGTGLFAWGAGDGAPEQAELQHPLGVGVAPGGDVLVADTYNGRLRRWDGRVLTTVAADLAAPAAVAVLPAGVVLVAESGGHRVVEIGPAGARPWPVRGLAPPPASPAQGWCVL